MKWIAIVIVVLIVIGVIQGALKRSKQTSNTPPTKKESDLPARVSSGTQVQLTNNQMLCLTSAKFDKPIYAENPSHMHSQMPNGADCFNARTVDSLVKKGFLVSDTRGGYLLTDAGAAGLKWSMGFRD